MNKRIKHDIIAGIDIDSRTLRMKIVEVIEESKTRTLEVLRQPISLGKDTFTLGKIRFETADATCEILKGFKKVMEEYPIKKYRVVATSAVREAKNRDYIIDQIQLKTGFITDVIDTSEERFLIYKTVADTIKENKMFNDKGILILDIGSGSLQVSIYRNNALELSQNVKLGSLRIREILSSAEGRTLHYSKILEEYIIANLEGLKLFQTQDFCQYFMGMGEEMNRIIKLCNVTPQMEGLHYIDKNQIDELYKRLLEQPSHKIAKEYNMSLDEAEMLLPSMMLFKLFMDMTMAPGILAPMVSLVDGVIRDLIDRTASESKSDKYLLDIVTSVRVLARRYQYDEQHAYDVEEKSLMLFDGLKKLHGLGNRERLLLQIATILHDIGKFINVNQHYIHSYEIIRSSDLMGISKEELEIIGNVACYHSAIVPTSSHSNFQNLKENNRIITAKLIAIIRIADALDRSHKQKIKNMKLKINDKELVIKAETIEDILLEQWTFESKADFFQEVFGITPILKLKRKI